ncbi:hypothetical protein GCM10027447_12860 [Glycomyces halotolerans]
MSTPEPANAEANQQQRTPEYPPLAPRVGDRIAEIFGPGIRRELAALQREPASA